MPCRSLFGRRCHTRVNRRKRRKELEERRPDPDTSREFLDGYNSRVVVLSSPEQLSKFTPQEKGTLRKYVKRWEPLATIFRDAISDFETLFGEKTSEHINEFDVAMEEALVRRQKKHSWKTVASEFISATSETREKMQSSWNLKGIANNMRLKTIMAL